MRIIILGGGSIGGSVAKELASEENDVIVVDNNNAKENVFNRVFKSIRKLATKKVNNYIAKQWIDNQLRMKKLSRG